MKPPIEFYWRGVHHLYLGAWLVAFGLFFLYMNRNNSLNILNIIYKVGISIGIYCIIDDIIEHLITANTPLRLVWNVIEHLFIKY